MWIAIILACSGTDAYACKSMALPDAYVDIKECTERSTSLAEYLQDRGYLATSSCSKVSLGQPL